MATPTIPYERGRVANQFTDYNFIASYDVIKEVHDPNLVSPYGTGRLSGILDVIKGGSKETPNIEYYRWEKKRTTPKILATNAGAGAAGASVVFTLAAAASYAVTYDNSPNIASGVTKTSYVPRVSDLILIKAASTITYNTYVHAYISAVSGNTFTAFPLSATDSIPSISTADEIFVYGMAIPEGGGYPTSQDSDVVKFQNNIQTFKNQYVFTDYAENLQTWINIEGRDQGGWVIKGEREQMTLMLNNIDMSLIIGQHITNPALATALGTSQVITTSGLVQEMQDFGNTYAYGASVNDYSTASLDDISRLLDRQKGAKENWNLMGFDLRQAADKTFTSDNRVLGGGLVYGVYNWDANMKLNFMVDTVKNSGYTYHHKLNEAWSDVQTFGASGYAFPKEGMIIPMDDVIDGMGERVPALRKRHLKGKEFQTSTFNHENTVVGESKLAVRYKAYVGFEGFAFNRYVYLQATA